MENNEAPAVSDNGVPAVSEVGEAWRGTYGGMTYRIFVRKIQAWVPALPVLQRMISQGTEPETWETVEHNG